MIADAYATAFMVLGVEKSKALLEQNPSIDGYLIYTGNDGEITTYITDGIAANIESADIQD
jgi:thiamine biosynthesis lipoprotein